MKLTLFHFLLLLLALLPAGCAAAVRSDDEDERHASSSPRHTPADTRFMQGMIAHHHQALVMTALVTDHTESADIHSLAERIEVSQQDEIRQMERWLRSRGETVPDPATHEHLAAGHGDPMPGMLTATELDRLERARGVAFDRLFLESMIHHHQGALEMVGQLLATPGAAQEVDAYRFASDVDADQRTEIERMRRMLDSLGPRGTTTTPSQESQ